MYYKETFLIAITLISTIIADDYPSNEEVTPTSLDFFDAENTDEFFDPLKQPIKNIQDILNEKKKFIEDDDRIYKSSTEDQQLYQKHSVLTTMVPPEPIQTISTLWNDSNADDIDDDVDESDLNETASSSLSSISSETHNEVYGQINIPQSVTGRGALTVENDNTDQYDAITTTLTAPTVRTKQGKQIPIPNLLPHQALRKFIEDAYIRTPLAILIDTASNSLDKTKTLWKDSLRSNAPMDVVLLAFNTSGVSVTYSFKNTRTLLAGLDSIQEANNPSTSGNAFFGIIRASELIPYDSAVFISTASPPADSNLAQYAAIRLLKKRIRLYLIWFGEKPSIENETHEEAGGILGKVAIRSGGEVLFVGNKTFSSTSSTNEEMISLLSETYQGPQEIDIPIDATMSDLHIKVDTAVKTATLETPNGG